VAGREKQRAHARAAQHARAWARTQRERRGSSFNEVEEGRGEHERVKTT